MMNKCNFIITLLFSTAFLLLCNHSQKSELAKNSSHKANLLNSDQIAVICEVLKEFPHFGSNESKTFLFCNTLLNNYSQDTVGLSYYIEKDSSLFAYQYLIQSYYNENKNDKCDILNSSIKCGRVVSTTDDISFAGKSILFTSIPAIDRKTGLAIIYAEISCGVRCGKSFFVFLNYTHNKWVIFKIIELWES